MKTNFLIKSLCILLALFGVQANAQNPNSQLKVWGNDITMVADGKTNTQLTISETDNANFCIINMSIIVPEGISVAKVKQGRLEVNDIKINPDRVADHDIVCNMPDPTTIKVMLSSDNLLELFPDDIDGNPETELFTIGLIADPSMVNGVYEIKIIDSKFIPADGKTRIPKEPITFKMTVTGGVDGVTINSSLSKAGYGTLILPFDAEIPEGVEAYTCTDVLNGVVQTEKQSKITANVPLLIKGTPGIYSFIGKPTNEADKTYTTGVLTGVYKDNVITSGYVLQQLDGVTGFYPVNASKPITVPANRCYLQYADKLQSIIFDGNITKIDELHLDESDMEVLYDMQGKQIKKANVPGVYIKGDKKIIVK